MENIKNPYKLNIIFGICVGVVGVLVWCAPFLLPQIGGYQFYFYYFGAIFAAFSLGWVWHFNKLSKKLKMFLENDEITKCIFTYDENYYNSFIEEMLLLQKNASTKKIWTLVAVIGVLSLVLYIYLPDNQKILSLGFAAGFLVMTYIFVWVAPNSYQYKALTKPYYSIISKNEGYFMGRYHSWTRCNARIKEHSNGEHKYKVLALNYEAFTNNGRMFREWSVLIPKNNVDLEKESKVMVSTINKATKAFEAQPKKKDIFERSFDKLIVRSDSKKTKK